MGIEDRDWYRDAQRERERRNLGAKAVSPTKTGLIPMMVFWCVVMGLLYLAMTHYLKPKQVQVLANGDLVIHRSYDGHFYTTGTVNGREARFLVDTGASLVSVSEAFAQKAYIRGGVPTTFKTANGDRLGRVVDGVGVSIGPVSLSNIKVGVGISASDENEALLGQSFLSKFDITISKNQMVLRAR
jgi:aspartyl protease family protein